MSAAEREAERRYVMGHGAGYSYPREAVVTMKRGAFEAGAAWQAERDAVRIAELEDEVERLRAESHEVVMQSSREKAELILNHEEQADELVECERELRAAEAKLDAVRALHQRAECLDMQGEPYDPPEYYCEHCYPNVWDWPCPTVQAIEGDDR